MLYCISSILLFLLVMFVPKTKEKINIIKTLVIFFIGVLAYHTLVCYCFTFVNIPITLTSLSIINFILSIIIIGYIIKKKQIQKYYINKKDILVTIIILFVVFLMSAVNFRLFTRIRYLSMDGMQHYKAASEFSENTALFYKAKENSTTATSHMPMGYVNVGILFKILKPWLGSISLYKIYILWETWIYFLVGMIGYFCIKNKLKRTNEWLIGILFLIFYLIGYPLNALISGFHYLVIGILYFMAIFEFFLHIMPKKEIKQMYKVLILSLFNLGLIFSYCLFCPVIYLAEFIYLIIEYKNNRNIKQFFLFFIFALILTGLMGSHISIIERAKDSIALGIQLDGWIYQNNWSNIILFLPFTIYYLLSIIKEKGRVFEKSVYILFAMFFMLLALGTWFKLCSPYYFYKNYYILWFLLFFTNICGMIEVLNQNDLKKYVVSAFTFFYLFSFCLSCTFINSYIQPEGKEKEGLSDIMQIYTFNKTNMLIDTPFVSKEELNLLSISEKELEYEWKGREDFLFIGTPSQERWLQALTGYYDTIFPNVLEKIENWNNGKYQYILVFNKEVPNEIMNYIVSTKHLEFICQNEAGFLAKYHK